jgi:hypothetical protein
MRPDQIARSGTEHAHQSAFFAWINHAKRHGIENADLWARGSFEEVSAPDNRLEWIFAIPNGGSRGGDPKSRAVQGSKLKAEGVTSGVADIFVPWPTPGSHGLYIEMKKPDLKHKTKLSNGASDEQKAFLLAMYYRDYSTAICYTWLEAVEVVIKYLGIKP